MKPDRQATMKTKHRATTAFDLRRIERESFVRQVEFHPLLASTNDRALQLAAEPDVPTPLLVLAEQQSAGRGRGANRWWSGPGALTFSLVLAADALGLSPPRWPRVALAAGVAVCEVLQPLVPHLPCGIRWPNDVHLSGRKVCGILSESRPAGMAFGLPSRLVLGIGINVNNSLAGAPPEVRGIGISLCEMAGAPYDLTDFLLRLLGGLAGKLDALGRDDRRLAESWSQLCLLRGRAVELDLGTERVCERCQGTDAEGALLLETPHGTRRFFGGVIRSVGAALQTRGCDR